MKTNVSSEETRVQVDRSIIRG